MGSRRRGATGGGADEGACRRFVTLHNVTASATAETNGTPLNLSARYPRLQAIISIEVTVVVTEKESVEVAQLIRDAVLELEFHCMLPMGFMIQDF
jgi:hypothetical protein